MRVAALILMFFATSAFAQIHSIEITFTGVGCVPCIESMPSRAQRIRGVESAKVDANQGKLFVKLASPNRVRVEQMRDVIEQDGTKATTAIVEVSGTLEQTEPTKAWILRVPQHALPFRLEAIPASLKPGATIRIKGSIDQLKPPDSPPALHLRITEVQIP